MKSMVVLFALVAAACGSLVQPAYQAALVLDAHGRPLDTAAVAGARALHLQAKALEGHYAPLAYAAPLAYSASLAYAAPQAVSHQARVDVRSSPALVLGHSAYAAPLLGHSSLASPLLGHSAYGLGGHLLKKRSLGHYTYSAPVLAVAPSAVSHQSRVDVRTSPAVVSHSVVAPVVAHAAPLVHATPVLAVAPSAVSHQSRVDVRTSPALLSHSVAAPVYSAHSVIAPSYYAQGGHDYGYGHLLKKRSVGAYYAPIAHIAPSAVSHQSRVDVISKPAVVTEVVSAPVLAHAAPLAYSASLVAPLAHSAVWPASAAQYSHSGLLHAAAAW